LSKYFFGENKLEHMEKLRVLLPHWIEHNRGHAEECGKWSALARDAGEVAVAEHIDAAIAAMMQAGELLDKALSAAGGDMPDHGHHHHH
jgi:phage tail tape-measure protein